ncbi:Variable outer membrane protein (plasmid) [Borrelia hermsii YBT]|uniref:Variable outer membrane protein n=1 Tax=Borrelia hermsii YBT TaxID=1313295 RepID=W5T7K3_BORHE|nr:Variable outer membrane protein [Borrelia hermsii YBT]
MRKRISAIIMTLFMALISCSSGQVKDPKTVFYLYSCGKA